ncbi:hypothetical protein [Saccharopolyspora erythraea]|uniref:Uncharacterized protein n=1 Tax=Saccharopolyspora erythraea (strain ATCC 11635 / DSM 40517 / JCM 4748 / NBRC 13426 / NCIMB 8594 / NRRL 2338) TaxID=405948 RepID=A4FA07_SACEN|nr:hypothetical protein [Saccharopolyspora erythraea]QRK91397.1 hypothetical protein JQX30_08365 [Saccharopolyspora erythraea]CAM00882.1 hypothetical protein SACE_1560 [Saccharopolyspora erythraea NRRL 2338]
MRLDGRPLPAPLISASNRVIALNQAERPDWEEVKIEVRFRTPRELRTGGWQVVGCYSSLSERRTNTRSLTRLVQESDDVWAGVVLAHHDDHRRRIDLDALITATVREVPGRIIGRAADMWTIDLEARTPARKNTVKAVWSDFTAADKPFLNPYRDDPWTIEASGEEPTLYLNSAFEGLRQLMRTSDRTTRDVVGAQVASDMWVALFNAAAASVETDADGQPEWPSGWRAAVLRRMLPDVFPEHSPDDALIEIHSRREQGEESDLQARLLHAASRQAQLPKRLSGFIRILAKKENL